MTGLPHGSRARVAGAPRPGRLARRTRAFLLGAAVLALAGFGCSGLKPQEPVTPIDPNSPCARPLEIFLPLNDGLTRVGTETTLDIATWNMEFFPLDLPGDYNCGHPIDPVRVEKMAGLINTLGLDIILVQELSDPAGFTQLLAKCPDYDGVNAPEVFGCNYQRVAFIWRKDQVVVHAVKSLFTGRNYSSAFPRPPLEIDVTITSNGQSYDLNLIAVHLKASGGSENVARRREASTLLKTYLDQQAALNPGKHYLVGGDWNDVITPTSSTANSFPDLLADPNSYKFLDMALAGRTDLASYSRSLIDHLMVNKAACETFSAGKITTLRLDLVTDYYSAYISDHRPVMVQVPVFQ
jgi:endonuclease/exonuclease/phosphatase family metal-dependent hydrolase